MLVAGTGFDYSRSVAIDVCGSAAVAIAINNNSECANSSVGFAAPWLALFRPPRPHGARFNVSVAARPCVDQYRLKLGTDITDCKGRVSHTAIGIYADQLQMAGPVLVRKRRGCRVIQPPEKLARLIGVY
jgi:hypothetical protein